MTKTNELAEKYKHLLASKKSAKISKNNFPKHDLTSSYTSLTAASIGFSPFSMPPPGTTQ